MSSKMSLAAVRQAFDAHLLTFTAGGDVNLAGTDYTPQAGKPYLSSRLTYQRSPVGIGTPVAYEVRGTYQVNVNRPAIEGLPTADSLAARIVELFQRNTTLALATGAVLTVMSASEQAEIPAGDWLTVPVVIEWYGTE